MRGFVDTVKNYIGNKSLQRKVLITLGLLLIYRLFVFIPVPFADIDKLMTGIGFNSTELQFLAILLGGTLDQFSIIAVGLIPFINASIIMQLLTAILPKLEELQQQGETGTMKIQQYTRWLTLPLAFVQSIGMIYLINSLLNGVIPTDLGTVLLGAFVMTVASMILLWIGELITEKGISNGISLIIFASIVSGIVSKTYSSVVQANSPIDVIIFLLLLVVSLVILTLYLVKTIKEIPVMYARQGKISQTSSLPIPLNPVGMVPIIFAISFLSFPFLVAQFVTKFQGQDSQRTGIANWISTNLNINTQTPTLLATSLFFLLIVVFTFFYTIIVFNPDRMALNIQQRGGYIPGVRPGEETAAYINNTLMQLCLWGGIGLGIVGIYSYVLHYIPVIRDSIQALGTLPIIVSGSGIVIIVGVVQEVINKSKAEVLMEKYSSL